MLSIRPKLAILAVAVTLGPLVVLTAVAHIMNPTPKVVFIGDSVTANWPMTSPETWKRDWGNRGVGGQRSDEVRARFGPDVIALHPREVHILVGINDIGGKRGLLPLSQTEANIALMASEARAARIGVVIGTVEHIPQTAWRGGPQGNDQVDRLNAWIRVYAVATGARVADYEPVMNPTLTSDGVHPNAAGYAVMAPIARQALD